MKIRAGFVSNSSSSSFVAVVKKIIFQNIENSKYDVFVECDGGEGMSFFKLPKEIYDYLKKEQPKQMVGLRFYQVVIAKDDGDTISMKELKNVPDDFVIYGGERDYNDPETVEDFKLYALGMEEE